MIYIGTTEAAFLLHLSCQRLRQLLAQGRVEGAVKEGRFWRIPLFNGMPKITSKEHGPKGKWRKRHQEIMTYIHVIGANIRRNMSDKNRSQNIKEPVIVIKRGSNTSILCHGVDIPGFGRIVYNPDKAKQSGAQVWFEIDPDIKLNYYNFA